MKYKALFVFFFGIVLSLILINTSFAKVIKTPVIEGRVIDAITGQPIENVIVSCVWLTSAANLVERNEKALYSETVITGKDGKFRFNSKTTWQLSGLLRSFDGMEFSVNHPLYESKNANNDSNMNWRGDAQYWLLASKADKNNVMQMDISILSLEQKYKIDSKTNYFIKKDLKPFDFYADIQSHDTAYYWITLDKYNISYDIELVFCKWRDLSAKFPGGSSDKYLKDLQSKIVVKLRGKGQK